MKDVLAMLSAEKNAAGELHLSMTKTIALMNWMRQLDVLFERQAFQLENLRRTVHELNKPPGVPGNGRKP